MPVKDSDVVTAERFMDEAAATRDGAPAAPGAEVGVLLETVRDLVSTLSTREVIERLLARVLQHLDSEMASILLVDRDGMLRIEHAHGLPADVMATTCVAPGEGIAGHVAATGRALLIEDIEHHGTFQRRNHERYYTSSALCAPLEFRGRVLGVINVNNRRDRAPYSLRDLALVEAIAAHATIALANARLFEETLERAQKDALTQLANHGHFWATLEVEVERARRYGHALSVAILDVDHFKRFNDRFGHRAGDGVLAAMGTLLRERTRACDVAARYGGEEFAVILPETPIAGALTFAEKIRACVASAVVPPSSQGDITVSIGLATLPDDSLDAAKLVETADARLYAAKNAGRNRICGAG
jgi:diguanylate cyclase (GGDEF)-like protein